MYDCKTLYGLIQNVFVPWLQNLQPLSLSFTTLHPSFLWITDTIVFAKFINKSSLSSKPPSKVFEINKARGGGGGGGGGSWFMVYEMVGISLAEVYERVENFVILVHEKA